MKAAWTRDVPLPGGDLPAGGLAAWIDALAQRYPAVPADVRRGLARRHGSRATRILDRAGADGNLGERFGAELTTAEIAYLVREEWARTADDVLWRRTKCGLPMTAAQRARVAAYVSSAMARA
jgi:glycerol-3-phosphate dehydrogenase